MASSLLEGIAEEKGGIKGGYRGTSSGIPRFDRDKLKIIGATLVVVGSVVAISLQLVSRPDPRGETERMTVIDSETNSLSQITLREGMIEPYVNPGTGRRTLYRAEKCYWTREGKAKIEPTYVLVKATAGLPGETICPDCGRAVRALNPLPPVDLLNEASVAGRRK